MCLVSGWWTQTFCKQMRGLAV
uniref:Uncharacterized protein n=1 Tax=Anguilla anguilla TaxID=7936 RepID=A0A0E9RNS5_ANGAN